MNDKQTPSIVAGFHPASVQPPKPAYVKPVYQYAHLPLLTAKDVPDTTLMRTLYRAVQSKRAHGSMAEARFVAWLVNRLPVTMIDGGGNIHVDLRDKPEHQTMFTAHTDTVHRQGGPNAVRLDTSNPESIKWRADEGSCLGADDGAGIALMTHMIDARVPGLYVFFRDEESGGTGSQWLAKMMQQSIKDIKRCVSLDRADYSDVVTHQGFDRCCSDAFAEALAAQLTTEDMSTVYMPDNTGVFTDSANFTRLIPECTNLSVGYKHQHGDGEWQDVSYLPILAAQLVNVKWDELPTERDQKALDEDMLRGWRGHLGGQTYIPSADEEDFICALIDAAEGSYTALIHYVAEELNDIEPRDAYKFVHPTRLKHRIYGEYAEAIQSGETDMQLVLEILAADLYKA